MNLPGLNETRLPALIQAIRDLGSGRTNAIGLATLDPGTSTVVESRDSAPDALVLLAPLDAGAAAAGLFVKEARRGSFVLGHAAGASGRRVRFEVRRT